MAEKINIINNVESGKRPTDAVIRKLERTLDIVLMVDAKPDENRHVNSGQARGLTLGDFLLGWQRMSRNFTVPVHAIWLAQDDPKKNTAVKHKKK